MTVKRLLKPSRNPEEEQAAAAYQRSIAGWLRELLFQREEPAVALYLCGEPEWQGACGLSHVANHPGGLRRRERSVHRELSDLADAAGVQLQQVKPGDACILRVASSGSVSTEMASSSNGLSNRRPEHTDRVDYFMEGRPLHLDAAEACAKIYEGKGISPLMGLTYYCGAMVAQAARANMEFMPQPLQLAVGHASILMTIDLARRLEERNDDAIRIPRVYSPSDPDRFLVGDADRRLLLGLFESALSELGVGPDQLSYEQLDLLFAALPEAKLQTAGGQVLYSRPGQPAQVVFEDGQIVAAREWAPQRPASELREPALATVLPFDPAVSAARRARGSAGAICSERPAIEIS